MSQNETAQAPLTSAIQMGESIIEKTREQSPSTSTEEQTSNDETKPTEPAKSEPEFNSGSKKARQLGESRRKIARVALEGAMRSEGAAKAFKDQMESDPQIAKYLKENWPREYNQIITGEASAISYDADAVKMQAKLEVLSDQLKEEKQNEVEDYAEKMGFSEEETEQLKDLVSQLDGKNIGGLSLDFKQALTKAAYAIRPEKAKHGVMLSPGAPYQEQIDVSAAMKIENLAQKQKEYLGGNLEKIKTRLEFVEKNLKNNVLKMRMD